MVKVAVSAGFLLVVTARLVRSKQPREHWGLVAPTHLKAGAALVALYLAWMLGTDLVTGWRGPWDFGPWRAAPLAASAMRVLAVCLLGPAAEEMIFRGLLFGLLKDRIGVAATIAVTALGWALLHYTYAWWVIGIIVVDGLLFGLARWRTGSVYVPIAMHVLYNLYAIW
jgi:membrane protease YdiL (CAAX protease family)